MANLTKSKKVEMSKKIREDLIKSDVIFIIFDGLNFGQLQQLRDKLKEYKSSFKIMRNSVLFYAAKDGGMVKDDKKPDFFKGPTAAVLLSDPDEISNVSKLLVDFSKSNPSLRIKGGFMSKDVITADVVKQISKVGSKKDLMARLAGTLYSSLSNIRSVIEAPIRDLTYVIDALKDQKK